MKFAQLSLSLALFILCLLTLLIFTFSSVTASHGVARVKGGSGTVEDPLLIELEGNAGLLPFLDSLLPFRGIPAIELSYVGERFYLPGVNDFFLKKQTLAKIIYLVAIFLFLVFFFITLLKIAGKRIVIIDARR